MRRDPPQVSAFFIWTLARALLRPAPSGTRNESGPARQAAEKAHGSSLAARGGPAGGLAASPVRLGIAACGKRPVSIGPAEDVEAGPETRGTGAAREYEPM